MKVGLGTRPEKFMGSVENWDKAEKALAQAFEKRSGELGGCRTSSTTATGRSTARSSTSR